MTRPTRSCRSSRPSRPSKAPDPDIPDRGLDPVLSARTTSRSSSGPTTPLRGARHRPGKPGPHRRVRRVDRRANANDEGPDVLSPGTTIREAPADPSTTSSVTIRFGGSNNRTPSPTCATSAHSIQSRTALGAVRRARARSPGSAPGRTRSSCARSTSPRATPTRRRPATLVDLQGHRPGHDGTGHDHQPRPTRSPC